jgi:streptogramin lyase
MAADVELAGIVVDLNGRPVPQAQVSLRGAADDRGADVVTVFTGDDGRFALPEPAPSAAADRLSARHLDFEQIAASARVDGDEVEATLVVTRRPNQAEAAPASAWLTRIGDRREKANFVLNCVSCHQVPSPEVRDYAGMIADAGGTAEDDIRRRSWLSITHYMNYLSGWEFGRASPGGPPEAQNAYSVGPGEEIAATLSDHFPGEMNELRNYGYGAPVIVTPDTVIREYEVPGVNAIREAMMVGSPPRLWVADVATNRMIAIDVATGEQETHEVPFDGVSGPHSLHRASDGALWITPLFPSVIARLDPIEESWRTWPTRTSDGVDVGIHDLSFGAQHELLADDRGRVWYSDIRNNAVGFFDPDGDEAAIFPAPEIEGRPGAGALLYGLVMTSDRKHVWYSQLGIGSFGSYNVETGEFETRVVLPLSEAGPRRLSISDEDVMYVPLYGSGQLIEYDTAARRQIGIYDLPDTGSAPYAVTWDPVRRVVWIATANADAIYRFDPLDKTFGVIPMPRTGAFLRMIDVDPKTGVLVTAYANIVEFVKGPRMALIVDPGDGAYRGRIAGDGP